MVAPRDTHPKKLVEAVARTRHAIWNIGALQEPVVLVQVDQEGVLRHATHRQNWPNIYKRPPEGHRSEGFYVYIYIYIYRSEGFPNGIFGPWARWIRALARWEGCWDVAVAVAVAVAVVAVIWKFRLTFRPGNYIWSFQIGF